MQELLCNFKAILSVAIYSKNKVCRIQDIDDEYDMIVSYEMRYSCKYDLESGRPVYFCATFSGT